jgi:hypothetical protein
VLSWLRGKKHRWPEDVPRLYPDLEGVALSQFFSEAQYKAALEFPILTVCPFISEESAERDSFVGVGLARLVARDLMLVRDLSVRGPEDTPSVPFEALDEFWEDRHVMPGTTRRQACVGGVTTVSDSGLKVTLRIIKGDGESAIRTIEGADFRQVGWDCATAIADVTGGTVTDDTRRMWEHGRPESMESLARYGWAQMALEDDDARRCKEQLKLCRSDPAFVIPRYGLDADYCDIAKEYDEGRVQDPFDAQLLFFMFIHYWSGRGDHQPEAVQFLRRAIEISPGHGKAHMCAPHAAHSEARMLHHSHLGYWLLPGNPFAINNYIINLMRAERPISEIAPLAEEGILCDPEDPTNYERLIELLLEAGKLQAALGICERLHELYEPEMRERTLYCLQQNPEVAKQLEAGTYDPAQENLKRMKAIRSELES